MKNGKYIISLLLLAVIFFSCEDTNRPVGVLYPEKFTAKISGNVNTEIIYDEEKVVAASGGNQVLEDEADS